MTVDKVLVSLFAYETKGVFNIMLKVTHSDKQLNLHTVQCT